MKIFISMALVILVATVSFGGEKKNTDKEAREKVTKKDKEWKKILTPMQYNVCFGKGTEPPFTGKYWDHHEKGVYTCVVCATELFSSDAKYDSGSGWPSYFQPVSKEVIKTAVDTSLSMVRTEILCAQCGSHLGHVFEDGPRPTGLRYCVNSASLNFVKAGDKKK